MTTKNISNWHATAADKVFASQPYPLTSALVVLLAREYLMDVAGWG